MRTQEGQPDDPSSVGQEGSHPDDTAAGSTLEPYPRGRRLFGLPIQFIVVAVVSLVLTVYLGAWTADARIEARSQAGGEMSAPFASVGTGARGVDSGSEWESAFLWVCPFH